MVVLRYVLILALVLLPASPLATTFPVTKTADSNDGTCDPDCSLREALGAANSNPGADDVTVPAGNYLLTLGQLVVTDDVSISGAGQTSTIIDGNALDRVFDIETPSEVVGISSVTIQNGYADYYEGGGGILHRSGALTLTDATVNGNSAGYDGGGIESYEAGDLTLIDTTVSGNTSEFIGGGIGRRSSEGHLRLVNSTVIGNSANSGSGGGIYDYSFSGDLTLSNSTVSGNSASGPGGITDICINKAIS